MKTSLFIGFCLMLGCQTTAPQGTKASTVSKAKSQRSSKTNMETHNEAFALTGKWDEGLVDYGDKERSRKALDLK